MEFELISSRENRIVKSVRKLMTSASYRRQTGLFLLEGLRLSVDAVQNGYTVETVIVTEKMSEDDRIQPIYDTAKQRIMVTDALFKYICDTVNPQGVLCIVKIPNTVFSADSISSGQYIMLENTADPANLGAIARTAEALGISGLIIGSAGCDPFSPKSQRAAMGALLRLPLFICGDCLQTVEALKTRGFSVFASIVSGEAEDLSLTDFPRNSVALIGNEANGLTVGTVNAADRRITIKMSGRAESLNAAAAAAIIMWQMTKAGGK